MDIDNLWALVSSLLFALLGGIASYLKDVKRFCLFSFIRKCVLSMFTGMVVFFILTHYGVAPYLIAASTSLSGFIGIPVIEFIWTAIQDKIKKL